MLSLYLLVASTLRSHHPQTIWLPPSWDHNLWTSNWMQVHPINNHTKKFVYIYSNSSVLLELCKAIVWCHVCLLLPRCFVTHVCFTVDDSDCTLDFEILPNLCCTVCLIVSVFNVQLHAHSIQRTKYNIMYNCMHIQQPILFIVVRRHLAK